MEYEEHDVALEQAFESLSDEQVRDVLRELGTIYFKDVTTIPKKDLYYGLEWDYPLDRLRRVIRHHKKTRLPEQTEARTARKKESSTPPPPRRP